MRAFPMRARPLAIVAAIVLAGAWLVPVAQAYDKTGSGRPCTACHAADPSRSRSGPHGGYTTGTSKCETCHNIHASSAPQLLPAASSRATCEVCHDDTGGSGVYGVLESRGLVPGSMHRIDTTNLVPSGLPSGEATTVAFSGPGGTLTCVDCHSPHDNQCVEPFIGDRPRFPGDTSQTLVPSDRLLRQRPTGADTSTPVYGSAWCASCHRGRLASSGGPGLAPNHPVEQETSSNPEPFNYGRVAVVTGVDSRETTMGPLGGSNFGYVMPDLGGGVRTPAQAGHKPICQQCHEDARSVGNAVTGTGGSMETSAQGTISASEVFRVNEPDSADASGTDGNNPRFQTFPHEGQNPDFLVETGDSLCLNCHLP
jgi:predicted CXXCH cytochrome family protein